MKTVLMPGPFSFAFDYEQPIEKLVEVARFGLLNPNINNQNFPPSPIRPAGGQVDGYLVQFDEGPTEEDVTQVAEDNELRLATTAELLTFGIQFPDEYKRVSIIALGQKWIDPEGNNNVVRLATELDKKDRPQSSCNLAYVMKTWPHHAVFLLV